MRHLYWPALWHSARRVDQLNGLVALHCLVESCAQGRIVSNVLFTVLLLLAMNRVILKILLPSKLRLNRAFPTGKNLVCWPISRRQLALVWNTLQIKCPIFISVLLCRYFRSNHAGQRKTSKKSAISKPDGYQSPGKYVSIATGEKSLEKVRKLPITRSSGHLFFFQLTLGVRWEKLPRLWMRPMPKRCRASLESNGITRDLTLKRKMHHLLKLLLYTVITD